MRRSIVAASAAEDNEMTITGNLLIGQTSFHASHGKLRAVDAFTGVRIDPAMPDRQSAPRADLRLRHIPVGPVAVFGTSNFPLAFSVAGGDAIAVEFAKSMTLGAGQFCTNPGLVLAVDGLDLDRFVAAAALAKLPAATMLTGGICRSYEDAVSRMVAQEVVETLGRGAAPVQDREARAALFATHVEAFRRLPALREEMFGAASLIVRCPSLDAMLELLESMEGQLTAALHIDGQDYPAARRLLPTFERRAGRVIVNGLETGVEVAHAMVHGGPYPSTSDGRTTSVRSVAIHRFLRPVSYQDLPESLLPDSLKSANPLRLNRRVDGRLVRAEGR